MEKKILVVDDSRLSREVYCQALEKEGFKVIVAANGKEGLDIVNAEKLDLVILDLFMPGIDGYGFLASIKSHPTTKYLPVIVLTGRDSSEEIDEAKKLGAFECFIKYKVKPMDLINIVKGVLS